jgi:hypothetical protein
MIWVCTDKSFESRWKIHEENWSQRLMDPIKDLSGSALFIQHPPDRLAANDLDRIKTMTACNE